MTGILVVTWNSGDVIGECLEACLRLTEVELLVVDNASTDHTVEQVRAHSRVRLIANRENRGFAGAVNQGMEALPHAAVLLLNPDAVPVSGITRLAELATAPGVGAAGGRLTGRDGKTQAGFNVRAFPTPPVLALETLGINGLWPGNPVNRRYRCPIAECGLQEVDQPAGAFLMVNREAWRRVGGLDEGFHPVWFEDVDFCLRLRQAGYRIVYDPGAVARHAGGHSAARLQWDSRQLFWYGSLLRFAGKHFSAGGRKLVAGSVMAALLPRLLMAGPRHGWKDAFSVYMKVFGLACASWRRSWGYGSAATGVPPARERRASKY